MILELKPFTDLYQEGVLGLGEHIILIPASNLVPLTMAGWICVLWYALSLAFTQISVLLLYMRVLATNWMRRVCYLAMATVLAYNIWVVISIFTACIPLQAFWDFEVQGRCYPLWVWTTNTALHIATDLMIFLLPFPVLRHLRMAPRQKMLVTGIFAMGFLLVVLDILH